MTLDIKAWQETLNKEDAPATYDALVLRDMVIPNILGDDTAAILYWAGRNLANNFALPDPHTLSEFCQKMHWGTLELTRQGRYKEVYKLSGDDVHQRLTLDPAAVFQLEAGFIAQTRQLQLNYPCEATCEHKDDNIIITCQLDPTDDDLDALNF